MSTAITELRTDFTADTKGLERGAADAAESIGDVEEALEDVGDQAALTDDQFEKLADELATMVRRAERAEGKARDLRGELRKLGREAADLDGTDVDIDVDIDTDGMGRVRRHLRDLGTDVDGANRQWGVLGGLAEGARGGIERLGQVFGTMPPQAQAAVVAVVASLATVTAALGTVVIAGLGAGAVLGGIAAWLYGRDPNTPMGKAVADVKTQFDHLATTLANVLQPVMDDIATVVGPILIDMIKDLQDWIVNNDEKIKGWAITFGKAFLTAVEVATYLGQALIEVAQYSLVKFISGMGLAVEGLGYFIRAIEWLIPGDSHFGQSLIDAGNDAQTLADDLMEMGDEGKEALEKVREGAGKARGELDTLTKDPWRVDVKYDLKVTKDPYLNRYSTGGALPTPRGLSPGSQSAGGRAVAGPAVAPAPAPVINIRVDGGDPQRVVRAIERYARDWGAGATVTA